MRQAQGVGPRQQSADGGVVVFGQGSEVALAAYIHEEDMEQDGERLTVWFGHLTVKNVGKGLEPLVGRPEAAGRLLHPGLPRVGC